jgi:hypothetical protein
VIDCTFLDSRVAGFAKCAVINAQGEEAPVSKLGIRSLVAGLAVLGGLSGFTTAVSASPVVAVKAGHSVPARHPKSAKVSARRSVRSLDQTPAANIDPQPNFLNDCPAAPMTMACATEQLSAINNARSVEGVAQPMTMNVSAFLGLTAPEQLFVITNLERTARGLPAVQAMTAQLDTAAATGAAADGDPSLTGWTLTGNRDVTEWSSNWAGDVSNLGADYFWMYDDGPGLNIDCPTAGAAGCWQHRANVLMAAPSASGCAGARRYLVMGAASDPTGYEGTPSIATLYVGVCGPLPTDIVLRWSTAQQMLAIA